VKENLSMQLRRSVGRSGSASRGRITDDYDDAPTVPIGGTGEGFPSSPGEAGGTQEVKVMKKRLDEVQQDNENLLCAVKYLKSKMEQKDSSSRYVECFIK